MLKFNRLTMFTFFTFFITANLAFAENRWIYDTKSTDLQMIQADGVRDRIYLLDSGNSRFVIIDSRTEKIIKTIPMTTPLSDMSISKNHRYAIIATDGDIMRVNLETLDAESFSINDLLVESLTFDFREDVYFVTRYSAPDHIYHLRSNLTDIVDTFGVGENLSEPVNFGLLRTDPTGVSLFVGQRDISPARIDKFDVTTDTPVFLGRTVHSGQYSIGSSMEDFAISPTHDELYVATTDFTPAIKVVDTTTLYRLVDFETVDQPVGVSIDRVGKELLAITNNFYTNKMYRFKLKPRGLLKEYDLLSDVWHGHGQPRGVAFDQQGKKAFIIHGHPDYEEMKVQVVDIRRSPCIDVASVEEM